MGKRQLDELRIKDARELKSFILDKKKEFYVRKQELASGKLKNSRTLKGLRREIAQALTILRQKGENETL